MPHITTRRLKGTTSTPSNALTAIFALPKLPNNGSVSLRGTVIARSAAGKVTAFYPVNSGVLADGALTQTGGTAQAAPCTTSPADGGTVQGFAPPGCSSTTDGTGKTTALAVGTSGALGLPAEFRVTGIAATVITWAWDIEVTIQTN